MVKEKRFQECSKLEQLWRYRWYLSIPFVAFYSWFMCLFEDFDDEDIDWTDFKLHWSLAIGMAQHRMKWYFTESEVNKMFDFKKENEEEYVDTPGDEDADDEESWDNDFGDHKIF